MTEQDNLKALAALIAREIQGAPPKPKLRLITTADLPPPPKQLYTDDERAWVWNEVRMWTRIYQLESYVRREMRGYATLEEMPDEDLQSLLRFVERAVQCVREEVPFDEAGLL